MDKAEFQQLVVKAWEGLPRHFKERLENVEIVVEKEMPCWIRHRLKQRGAVLGLYQGVPLKKRGVRYGNVLPDKITIYKNVIEHLCNNDKEVEKRIKEVLYHEIGHYFGLSEKELRRIIK